jgi:molybdopterin-binding protein
MLEPRLRGARYGAQRSQPAEGSRAGIKNGQVMAEITVDVEAGSVVAAITDSSRERLNLQEGDRVTVFVKSTEVMIGK